LGLSSDYYYSSSSSSSSSSPPRGSGKGCPTHILASDINQRLRGHRSSSNLSSKRAAVLEYRGGVDMYTQKREARIEDPHVDHITELQLISYAAAHACGGGGHGVAALIDPVARAANSESLDNYNVTSARINVKKRHVVTDQLWGRHRGEPFRVIAVDLARESDINRLSNAMLDASRVVEDELRAVRRSDGFVSGHSSITDVANELAAAVDRMDLENKGAGLRSRRRR
jgi:hypothetical protein